MISQDQIVSQNESFRKIDLHEAVQMLRSSGVVAYPTETIYGLGANAYSDAAVSAIFAYKKRSKSNPISVAYKSLEDAYDDVEITDLAQYLAAQFLPGPMTIIMRRKDSSCRISSICSAGLNSIGIRIPAHPLAIDLLENLPFPLTASSANTSGGTSHTTAEAIAADLENIAILDGGECPVKVASTVVDCSVFLEEKKVIIRREGAISTQEILEKCEGITIIREYNAKK